MAFEERGSMATSENLKRLASTFTVRDIMVTTGTLKCASGELDATVVSKANPEFSFIPIMQESRLSMYYNRDTGRVSHIGVSDLISDGTGVLDLVDVLEHQEFAFVQGLRQIDGYVHFSDLNHSLVKLTFYMLLEGVERYALDSVRAGLTNEFLTETLGESRVSQIQRFYKSSGDAGQSPINYLNIADILRLARRAGTIDIDASLIPAIKRVRNGAAHVSENLVSDYSDVIKLAEVKNQCLRVLRSS
jgi:hypothetical protein